MRQSSSSASNNGRYEPSAGTRAACDLRMFLGRASPRIPLDAQTISLSVEENVAGRSHLKKFALQFEFHDASSRASDAMSS